MIMNLADFLGFIFEGVWMISFDKKQRLISDKFLLVVSQVCSIFIRAFIKKKMNIINRITFTADIS